MNVTISTLNSQYIHSSLAPWCLFAAIKEYCVSQIIPSVIEGTVNENIIDVAERIIVTEPDVLGFGCYIWNINSIVELIKIVKLKLPDTIIILGGPEVSYNVREVMEKNPLADFVISGEGEYPLSILLNAIYLREDTNNIIGVSHRKNFDIFVAESYISDDNPCKYISPYKKEYYDSLKGRIAYLETSRGCPYSCAFCLSGRCGGVKFFDINNIKEEIIALSNSGTRTIKLVDRTFNSNFKRAESIFEFIIQNYGIKIPKNICFHFEIAGDILNQSTIEILSVAPAGLIQFEIGLQSFNEKTLESINRKTDTKKLKKNITSLIKNENIHIHIDLIAGLPHENYESFINSFNTAYCLKPHMLQLGFLKLLHGAPMRENLFPEYCCEYSKNPPYEVIETSWISKLELELLHIVETALDRVYNTGRFRRTLLYLIDVCGYSPFELFLKIGEYTKNYLGKKNISLDNYTDLIFSCMCKFEKVDKSLLRDLMVCDRLASNSSGFLPKSLHIFDESMKFVKMEMEKKLILKNKNGIKIRRSIAMLYSEKKCVVYVDYDLDKKNPITGEYPLLKYEI